MHKNIDDETLLSQCKAAVCEEKKSTARVLEFLSEIDKRRLWLKEGYSSLFDFCRQYLNYSEGEAYRRIQACRLSSRVEAVKPLLENNSLSLTTISLLAPLLNQQNAKEILPKIANKPTREVEKILEAHFPEKARKAEYFKVELDKELQDLLERAKLLASEKNPETLFKKVLRDFLRERKIRSSNIKKHTRYVPRPIAREVRRRDDFQCSYVSPKGQRCNQTSHLQIDHIQPYAKGGSSLQTENLRCLCRAHNLMFAKRDFPDFRRNSRA